MIDPDTLEVVPELRYPPVFAVVVTHSGPGEMLTRCLSALAAAGGVEDVLVVDNSSQSRSGSGADVSDDGYGYGYGYGSGSGQDVLRIANDGFGAAVNAGVSLLCAAYPCDDTSLIAILNDDVEVRSGWLDPLVDALGANPEIGAVQPKLLLAGTDPVQVNGLGVELDSSGSGIDLGFGEPDGDDWEGTRHIEIFTGGAVVVRARFFRDLGGFDERYFLYYEDVDLALRGRARGWEYLCVPSSTVWHAQGATTSTMGDRRCYLQERNRVWVAGRFGSPADLARAVWLSVRRTRHHPRRAHLRALIGGLGGLPRVWVSRARAAMAARAA